MKQLILILVVLALFVCASQSNAGQINAVQPNGGFLFVYGQQGIVSEYDATTGAVINSNFASINEGGNDAYGIAADNKGHVFVSNPVLRSVSEYNAATGQ
jgi:outer membrane protein assembly factor BamB